MRSVRAMWLGERRARWFFVAHLQGGMGAGAGYIALMLLAYERIGSAWAATAVMLADLIPSMLLGPLLGGLVDRTSRLGCAIGSDLLRASVFAALMFCGDAIVVMLALALLSGVGNALFRPATAALLPSLVSAERLTAANALYGMVRDIGLLLGPACAAGLLLFAGPELVLGVNAATFALSACLLLRLRGHVRPVATAAADASHAALAGIGSVVRDPLVRTLMSCSGFVVLAAGTMNVAELVLAQEELGSGRVGFALLVSSYGCGLIAGSLLGARDDDGEAGLRRRYLGGMALMVVGLTGSALSPALGFAMFSFAITGAGDGLFILSDRVLLQRMVPERLHGRAFGGRATFAIAGAGMLIVLIAASRALSSSRLAIAFQPQPIPVLR